MEELSKYATLIEAEETRQQLENCSFAWVLIIAKAIRHDKSVSYFGGIPLPGRLVEGACRSNSLHDFYVEKRWRCEDGTSITKGFEYRLVMDPDNNHYFSWLKFQLEKRNLWTPSRATRTTATTRNALPTSWRRHWER